MNLDRISWECVHFVKSGSPEAAEAAVTPKGFQRFEVDGAPVRSGEALLGAVDATMKFPSYFGGNWDALDECLRDLDWLPPAAGYVLVVRNAGRLWKQDALSAGKFSQAWLGAAEEWAKQGKPFHLVFMDM